MQRNATTSSSSPSQTAPLPSHLVVLVNGLWGWQRDWAHMKAALDRTLGSGFVMHISAVNVAAQTHAGIDVCGQRLAAEILQLISSAPSLTTLSVIGHSMGGLIARYAIGLLADPDSGTLAGLQPRCFITLASPHLGCSSSHPQEVHWQDRSYVRWLAAAVAAGHLGGHTHLAPTAAATAAAADSGGGDGGAAPDSGGGDGAAAANTHHSSTDNRNSSSNSNSSTSSSSSNRSRSSWSWPWAPCRSVIQLLGCDAWTPTRQVISTSDSYCCCCCSGSNGGATGDGAGGGAGAGAGGGGGDSNESSSSRNHRAGGSSSNSDCTVLCDEQQAAAPKPDAAGGGGGGAAGVPDSSCCGCKLSVTLLSADGSSSSVSTCRPAVHLLDALCHDCLVQPQQQQQQQQQKSDKQQHHQQQQRQSDKQQQHQQQQQQQQQVLYFLTGLRLFKHRATYSSAGGDHLIPWASSSLVDPQQLPVQPNKHTIAAAAAAAAATAKADSNDINNSNSSLSSSGGSVAAGAADPKHARLQLPVLGLFSTQPVIVEQHLPQKPTTEQQQQEQEQVHSSCAQQQQPSLAHSQQQQQQQKHKPPVQQQAEATAAGESSSGGGSSSSNSNSDACAAPTSDRGVLSERLGALQGLQWRRFHVVWPRLLCLGSSHCNIQYNGPINFVGRAVVEHVCCLLTDVACVACDDGTVVPPVEQACI